MINFILVKLKGETIVVYSNTFIFIINCLQHWLEPSKNDKCPTDSSLIYFTKVELLYCLHFVVALSVSAPFFPFSPYLSLSPLLSSMCWAVELNRELKTLDALCMLGNFCMLILSSADINTKNFHYILS